MNHYGLEGKVAIVTGASSGNGRGIALELAKLGMDVQCLARREEHLKSLVEEIEGFGGKGSYFIVDVTDSATLRKIFIEIIQAKEKIDLLVNNAGQNKVVGRTWELDEDAMWQEMTVNTKGTMVATKLAVEHMVKQGQGRVINITGGGTTSPHVFASPYSASKAAIARYSETVAMELESVASPVKVFTVRPGLVLNERTRALAESDECKEFWPNITERVLYNDQAMTTPDMLGDFIAYVASGAVDAYDGRDLWIKMDRDKLEKEADSIKGTDKLRLRMA